jgi:hypothetical protein
MEENRSYHFRSIVLATTSGIVLAACLALLLQHPIPRQSSNPVPGFGWSWDFDYESAMQQTRPTQNDAIVQPASNAADLLILPLNETVSVAGLMITYRGSSGSGKFRLDVIIPVLDPSFAYSHDLSEKEARKGFSLVDERFAVTVIGPYTLGLRHLSP